MGKCLLYRGSNGDSIDESRPWNNSKANRGLIFNKYASGWHGKGKFREFDKADNNKGHWLKQFAHEVAGDGELLKEAAFRQHQMVTQLGGRTFAFKNVSRFVLGMGIEHPIENGLTWHPTLGVPYLPGSSLKGIVRSWIREEYGNKELENLNFGSQDGVGELIFFDLLPIQPVRLAREIMTPHYGKYYQEKAIPGDWESPVPIQFLAVEKDCTWQLSVAFQRRRSQQPSGEIWQSIESILEGALTWLGAGAKTAVGYGRFDRVRDCEKRWGLEQQKAVEDRQKALQEAKEQEARESRYASMSKDLVEINRLCDSNKWLKADGELDVSSFINGLNKYLDSKDSLSKEVIDWISKVIKKRHPNLWDNPDETKGKKNKPIHKSTWIELVKKVKSKRQ